MQKQSAQLELFKFHAASEQELVSELRQNKAIMLDILEKAPKVGVYKHQTRTDWQIFFQFYMDFLRSQIGPRGVCAKKIRKELMAQQQKVNKLLEPFNLKAATHIREIYMKINDFVPCDEYLQLKKLQESRERYLSNIQKFQDDNSPMVKGITEGLLKKHGTEFDIKTELLTLKENYIKKLKESDQLLVQLRSVLDKCEAYHNFLNAQAFLEPYFKQWKTADAEMGRQNLKTGQLFEEKVFKKILPYLIFKETDYKNQHYQKHRLQVFTNSSWIPKSLGQIDIALGYKDQQLNRYFITTLIQCKSRFFDLREAHRQVSLNGQPDINKGPTFEQLKAQKKIKIKIQREKSKAGSRQKANDAIKIIQQPNQQFNAQKIGQGEAKKQQAQCKQEQQQQKGEIAKKFLSTKYGPAELVQNHHFYIITTLPQNEFVLPIESKMKEGIDKFTKNMFIEDIQSQPLFKALLERFEGVLSPLDWIKDYESQWKADDSNILVLK